MRAKIKPEDLRNNSTEKLKSLLRELELVKMQASNYMVSPKQKKENHTQIRKNIARIKTILREREDGK